MRCRTALPLFLVIFFYLSSSARADNDECLYTVKIQRGDSLSGICLRYLGEYSSAILQEVLQANSSISDPNRIYVGNSICIPSIGKKRPDKKIPKEASFQKHPEEPSSPPFIVLDDKEAEISPPGDREITIYPPSMPGEINSLKWISDNRAIVEGRIESGAHSRFYVYVPGDLEYEQLGLTRPTPDRFRVEAVIGRQGRDYDRTFILKLAIFDTMGERIGEIRRSILRKPHEVGEVISMGHQEGEPHPAGPAGWAGVLEWIEVQQKDALEVDNARFRVPNGRIVANYRYLGYNPDERYLSWYGRITLYGSSCLAKALILNGRTEDAEKILRPWAAQVMADGKIPRSANVIGDNYISPDIRTGEVAHFLGALAMARSVSGGREWDDPIQKIVLRYIKPLTEPESGLIRGGYNGIGSEGYSRPFSYQMVPWCSAEHNFDLFQGLILLSRVYDDDPAFAAECRTLAEKIGRGIDEYLWDESAGTFNRGWRGAEGPDRARALDCASWGALYLIKQARLARERNETAAVKEYLKKAGSSLAYAENNFKTEWYYRTPWGKSGRIWGYRPYDGRIDDLRYEDGIHAGQMIDWDSLENMVWSEGTMGVAKAWEEYAAETGDRAARNRARAIYGEMLKLQRLSDKGGLLYSTVQIKGHFTIGEELASLSWLAYMVPEADGRSGYGRMEWTPW